MNFDNTDVASLLNGYNATDFANASSYVSSNSLLGYFTANFNVPGFWNTSMGWLDSADTALLANNFSYVATKMGSVNCQGLDLTIDIQDNKGGLPGWIYLKIHSNVRRTGTNLYRVSLSITFGNN